ncbi:ketosteroid isomerase [Cellulomonas chitinilytica]|uniref:Ketosteroid isomerase n=1 Tax=Cellulomonas chitinilytica TaxID=398759 RepID=A0A919TZF6_9CELL|nr:nuclear transport factor 2 family protein [Cellulomonas chitinilytica]GIG21695.1 ketosteroid isomerase [Cellulomonas chitinilytica]
MTNTQTLTSTDEVVDAFFTAFGSGDSETLLGLFSGPTDLRANGAPNVPWVGAKATKDEVAAFFGSFGETLDFQSFELHSRITEGANAVAFATAVFAVKATGKTFRNDLAIHFSVADGKITRYHVYEDSYAIHEAFNA